jgi:UDP-glucose 4-epimerase
MKILLTGGAGYIGSHTAIAFIDAGYEVVLLDNLSNSDISVIERLAKIAGFRLNTKFVDVRDTSKVKSILVDEKIDAVIHFAGLKAVGESSKEPINYYSNNVQGALSLIEAMQEVGVHKLVFSSSATVYGDPQYLPIDEAHPLVPTNPYGRNKLQIEQMLDDLAASDPKWSIMCLRYFNPVGAHDSGLIGEAPTGIPNNLMPYLADVAGGIRSSLSVYGSDYDTKDGTGVRDYIHVMDLAEGHLSALNYISKHKGIEFVNLGNGIGYSVLEMIAKFEEISCTKVPHIFTERRAGDIATCYADPALAKYLLGWVAKRDLTQMCQSLWSWQLYKKQALLQ